jgi:hypothetical protein
MKLVSASPLCTKAPDSHPRPNGQMQANLSVASLWTGRHGALRAGSAGEQPAGDTKNSLDHIHLGEPD